MSQIRARPDDVFQQNRPEAATQLDREDFQLADTGIASPLTRETSIPARARLEARLVTQGIQVWLKGIDKGIAELRAQGHKRLLRSVGGGHVVS